MTQPPDKSQQFSLATLLLVTALVAVCLAAFRVSPGLGIAVVVIAVPALVRTLVVGMRIKRVGQPLSIGDKLGIFAASLGLFVLVGVAGVIAFEIACWGTFGLFAAANPRQLRLETLFWLCVAVGSVAAVAVAGGILWAMGPRKK